MFGDVNSDEFAFQMFDNTAIKDRAKAKISIGLFNQRAQHLTNQQSRGCGVYFMVNEGDGKGRSAKNVTRVRALFIDCDGSPWEPAATSLQPHIRIESSSGRWHLYWIVSDCPLDQFKPLQQAIARKYGGDPSVCDLPRVMRLPGFWHLKNEPVMAKLLECNDQLAAYTVAEIIEGLKLEEKEDSSSIPQAMVKHTSSIAQFEFIHPGTGEVIDLAKWAALHRDFDIVQTIRDAASHVVRGDVKDGRQHIECPFHDEHSDQAQDTATFIANRAKNKTDSFVINCLHAHCAGRDRLHFLLEMLTKGWIPTSVLDGTIEAKRPPKVYLPTLDMMKDSAWCQISGEERRVALHLAFLSFAYEDGTMLDDAWMVSRQLGNDITESDWQQCRDMQLLR